MSRLFALSILIFAGFFLISEESRAYWTDPTVAPTSGNLAVPLNFSSVAQTKIGPLTLGGSGNAGILGLYPSTFDPINDTCTVGQIAYNGGKQMYYYCDDSNHWQSFANAGKIFQLLDDSQGGWGFIKVADPYESSYGLRGEYSYIPYGRGIVGEAGFNPTDETKSIGIYGQDSGFADAYAGFFEGNIEIQKSDNSTAENPTKLSIGTSAEQVKLCLNNSGCLSDWWTSGEGDPFWLDNGPQVYLDEASPNRVLLGGTTATEARFIVRTGEHKSVVIGRPTSVVPYTCGDGICQTWEGNIIDLTRVPPAEVACPQDCVPVIKDVNVTPSGVTARVCYTVDELVSDTHVEYRLPAAPAYLTYPIPPRTNVSGNICIDLINLAANTEYEFRVYAKDNYDNETYTNPSNFLTTGCGDGICAAGETCMGCNEDCLGKKGGGGCLASQYCCEEGCTECCVGSEGQCPVGQACVLPGICQPTCANDGQCGAGQVCCSGFCKFGQCCVNPDPAHCDIVPFTKCYSSTCMQCIVAADCSVYGLNKCCTSPSGMKFCGNCCSNKDCTNPLYPECCASGSYLKCQKSSACVGGGGCFLAKTNILMADNSQKPIEEVKIGDLVYGYQDGRLMSARVVQTFKHSDVSRYYLLTLENSQRLKVTGIHPIFDGKEYIKVEDLAIGDTVYIRDNDVLEPIKITNIRIIDQSIEVYNLEVDQTNNYFAEGVLVHNKTWPGTPGTN
ncbi:MAG: polymorphic toxin-type HINT domain-containing protein [Patescibacteria group bacterium]